MDTKPAEEIGENGVHSDSAGFEATQNSSSASAETAVGPSVAMGSAESASAPSADLNSEDNSFADCESDFDDDATEKSTPDADMGASKNSSPSLTAEEEFQDSFEDVGVDASVLGGAHQVPTNGAAGAGSTSKSGSPGFDFEMDLIVKSLGFDKRPEEPPARKKRKECVASEEVADEGDEEDEEETELAVCRWPQCGRQLPPTQRADHESGCDKKLSICKWPKCLRSLAESERRQHEEACERRLAVCPWWGCDAALDAAEIGAHVEECGKEPVACGWPGCGEQALQRSDLERHRWACPHRSRAPIDCWICNRFPGSEAAAMVRHLREAHAARFEKGCSAVSSLNRGDFWRDCYKLSQGELFRCVCGFWGDGEARFCAEACGGEAAGFRLEVELFHPFDPVMETLKVQAECSTDANANSNFIKMEASSVEPFVHNGHIFFFHRISREIA